MADEHVEGNSPRNTSEATPPHVDDSPEMVSQPSPPPEEEKVTSSSDCQPPEVADSPVEQNVSSSFGQDQSVGAGSSSREAAGQITSDAAPEIENPPRRDSELARLLTAQPELPLREEPVPSTGQISSDAAPEIENPSRRDSEIARLLTAQPELPLREEPVPSTGEEKPIKGGELVRAAVDASLKGCYEPFGKSQSQDTKRNVDEESDDANQQFDIEDLSPASICSSENVDLGSDLSPTESGAHGEERRDSGSGATEVAGLGSDSSPRIAIVTAEKSTLGIGTIENVSLEGELPSSKTGLAISVSGAGATMDVGLKSESSPSKAGPSSLEGSSSASALTEKVSPKRKSPSKDQHLPPKRSTPSSPGKLQKQSDSQMSTLLEELDIKETKAKPGSCEPISGHEQNIEREESNESETGETEQESNMEVDETDSQEAQGETTEKCSKKDGTEKGDRE